VEKVTPLLNEAVGPGNWEVDTTSPSKMLTVRTETTEIAINEALNKKGYKAEAE